MSLRSVFVGSLLALVWATPGQAGAAHHGHNASTSGAPWFENEAFQLSANSLAHLDRSQAALFDFAQNETDLKARTWGLWAGCKVFPGDLLWPLPIVWDVFDKLLGGALIKTVPLAASCYSSWPEYDSNECETISSQWTDSHIQ